MLPKPVVEEHSGFLIVRDDLLKGGTKMRAIMPLIESSLASEFVYASPAHIKRHASLGALFWNVGA